jgi:xylulokinase
MSEYIMAYDFGTSGAKAVLIDHTGSFIAGSIYDYSLYAPSLGFAEQNPEDYWRAACAVTGAILRETGVPGRSIKGISFGTQGMGIIPVDENGETLYNNITWVDSRAGTQAKRINERFGAEILSACDVVPKLLWLKENKPEVYERTGYFLDCTGYLIFKSTGVAAMELTNSGPYSFDAETRAQKERVYDVAGIDRNKIPPLKTCATHMGNLTPWAAEALGLTTDTAVIMGTGDVSATAAGCGCVHKGDAHIYLGSSAWLSVMRGADIIKNAKPGVYQLCSIEKNVTIYGGCVQSACMTLDWAIRQFYPIESQMLHKNLYRHIDEEICDIEPGSGNLIATPWLHGERCPVLDEKARAVFFNVSNLHDRRCLIHAIMESVCYSLRGQAEFFSLDTGDAVSELRAVGGGAQSDPWMQMMADIMGTPVYRPANVRYAGAIGAAFIAGVGLGVMRIDDIKDSVRVEKEFRPRPGYVELYDKLYNVFKKIYPALKDLFAEMNG